jgi:hypothetical protein
VQKRRNASRQRLFSNVSDAPVGSVHFQIKLPIDNRSRFIQAPDNRNQWRLHTMQKVKSDCSVKPRPRDSKLDLALAHYLAQGRRANKLSAQQWRG